MKRDELYARNKKTFKRTSVAVSKLLSVQVEFCLKMFCKNAPLSQKKSTFEVGSFKMDVEINLRLRYFET